VFEEEYIDDDYDNSKPPKGGPAMPKKNDFWEPPKKGAAPISLNTKPVIGTKPSLGGGLQANNNFTKYIRHENI